MEFESLKDIIEFALEKEKEAVVFYKKISREESMSGTAEMLREFSREEDKHVTLLENIMKEGVDESVREYTLKWIVDIKRSDFVNDLTYEKGMPYNEILMVAMKREEKALALYNRLETMAENPAQVKVFRILAQEEAKHKLALETMYDDYMAEMGD